jgi:hypothetical protein
LRISIASSVSRRIHSVKVKFSQRLESNPPRRFHHIACGASLFTETKRKVLAWNADVLVGISTSEQDKYGNSEIRRKNAAIRGTAPSDL